VTARVLVLDAGSAGANNLIRSLRAGDPSIVIVGCNENRYVLKKSGADSNYVLDAAVSRVAALRRIVRTERIDLAIPTSDAGIQELSELRVPDLSAAQVHDRALPGQVHPHAVSAPARHPGAAHLSHSQPR
jgi:hypothetical protein